MHRTLRAPRVVGDVEDGFRLDHRSLLAPTVARRRPRTLRGSRAPPSACRADSGRVSTIAHAVADAALVLLVVRLVALARASSTSGTSRAARGARPTTTTVLSILSLTRPRLRAPCARPRHRRPPPRLRALAHADRLARARGRGASRAPSSGSRAALVARRSRRWKSSSRSSRSRRSSSSSLSSRSSLSLHARCLPRVRSRTCVAIESLCAASCSASRADVARRRLPSRRACGPA